MGLDLGSLTSLNPLSMVGDAVKGVVAEIIPGPFGKLAGDVAAGVVDYETGNIPGMLKDGMSALSDLKDLAQSAPSNGGAPGAKPSTGTPSANQRDSCCEPSPPPRLTTTTTVTTVTTDAPGGCATEPPGSGSGASAQSSPVAGGFGSELLKLLDPLGVVSQLGWARPGASSAPASQNSQGGSRPAPTAPSSSWRGTPPPQAGSTTTTVTSTTTTSRSSAPAAQPTVPAGAPPAVPASGPAGAPPEAMASGPATEARTGARHFNPGLSASSSPSPSTASTPSTSPTESSNVEASSMTKDNFMKLSDDDFMKAVRDGKIPKEVTDSQAGMMALQARMDHITEMNQMMTSMIQAIHQMKMGVIQNLRV